jgi:drug/metabolite transporter (DMT)-like permease
MGIWALYLSIGILFFVMGQIFLKYDQNDSLLTTAYFSITIGLSGLILLLYQLSKDKITNKVSPISYYGLLAGLLFFLGNFFWILSIKKGPSLSMIRIFMAGGETLLLLLAGYFLFKEKITIKVFIGMVLILLGLYLSLCDGDKCNLY